MQFMGRIGPGKLGGGGGGYGNINIAIPETNP